MTFKIIFISFRWNETCSTNSNYITIGYFWYMYGQSAILYSYYSYKYEHVFRMYLPLSIWRLLAIIDHIAFPGHWIVNLWKSNRPVLLRLLIYDQYGWFRKLQAPEKSYNDGKTEISWLLRKWQIYTNEEKIWECIYMQKNNDQYVLSMKF